MKKCMAVLMIMIVMIGCSCASAEIWIDTSQKTTGVWNEDHTEIVRSYTPVYEEMIRGKTNAEIESINELLYDMGWTQEDFYQPLTTGWTNDNAAYVSLDGCMGFWVYGNWPIDQCRCAALYRKKSGEILEEHDFIIMQDLRDGKYGSYFDIRLSDDPGVYEDITLVFSCGEDACAHTFDLLITQDVQTQINSMTEAWMDPGFLENGYGFYGSKAPTLFCDMENRTHELFTEPAAISPGEIVIEYPLEGKVMTGFDGVTGFRYDLGVAIGKTEGVMPPDSVTFTMTEVSTGKIVAQAFDSDLNLTDCGKFWEGNVLYSIDEQPFVFPSVWNPGEYRLTYDFGDTGSQSVSIYLEKEDGSPTALYDKLRERVLHASELRFLFLQDTELRDWIGNWNDEFTVYEADENGIIAACAAGLTSGEPYHCALIYTDRQGQLHSNVQSFVASDAEMIDATKMTYMISNRAGRYEDLTLVLVGDGQSAIHQFDCRVPETSEEEPGGVVQDIGYDVRFSGPIENPELQPEGTIPEKGFSMNWPVSGTYYGYPGCRLRVNLAFSEAFPDRALLEIALINKANNQVVAASRGEYIELAGYVYDFGGELELPDDLQAGEYTLRVSSAGCKQTADMILKLTESPFEVYEQQLRTEAESASETKTKEKAVVIQ